MIKKSFEKITVTEVCKCAGINRGTFYLHYIDVYDVLNELEEELLNDNVQEQKKYIKALLKECNLTESEAEKIFYFQLNGCLAVNKQIYKDGGSEWDKSRDLIGGFIQSGLMRYKK